MQIFTLQKCGQTNFHLKILKRLQPVYEKLQSSPSRMVCCTPPQTKGIGLIFFKFQSMTKESLFHYDSLLCISMTLKISKKHDFSRRWYFSSLYCCRESKLMPKAPKPLDVYSRPNFLSSLQNRFNALQLIFIGVFGWYWLSWPLQYNIRT